MVMSFFDMGTSDSAASWRSLRRRRAAPPALVGGVERKATFQSALEQAEQQFRAASQIDYDSRPLNLFYGLSQAGRAISAAAVANGIADWKLQGHGISVNRSMSAITGVSDFSNIEVVPDSGKNSGRTSFKRLATVLGSSQETFTLGETWPLMVETMFRAPLLERERVPIFMQLEDSGDLSVEKHYASPEIPPAILSISVSERPTLRDFLDRYPGLVGWQLDGSEVWPPENQGLRLYWFASPEQRAAKQHALVERLTRYRRANLSFPTIGAGSVSVHPLMAWWSTLFTLSMLARYEPARWTELIDVDSSPHATAIEFVLDTAIEAVPELVDEALDQVS